MKKGKGIISILLVLAILTSAVLIPIKADAAVEKYVKVTVTDILFNDSLTEYLDGMKFKKKVVSEEEFTTTYTMTESQQKKILTFLRKEVAGDDKEDDPKWRKSIKINKDFTRIKMYVDKKKYYKDIRAAFYILDAVRISLLYQQFAGMEEGEIFYNVSIIDEKTNKEIDGLNSDDLLEALELE